MIWLVFVFVFFYVVESYVLLQVRKNDANSSNVDALIHKVVPSVQLDKFTADIDRLVQVFSGITTDKKSPNTERRVNENVLQIEDIEKQDGPNTDVPIDFGGVKIANVKTEPAFRSHSAGKRLEIILIPGDKERAIDDKHLTVTLIPAGHCFGSVMFLFQTADKTVLFTGDFRIFEDDLYKIKDLHTKDGNPLNLDALYMDTEFQNEEYADFPNRSESVAYAIEEMRKWLRKSDRRCIALHVSAEFGYEYIFNEIFNELGVKVYVGESAWKFYSQVQELVPGVTNDPSTKIHLCSNRTENDSHDDCIQKTKEEGSKPKEEGGKTKEEGSKTKEDGSKTEVEGTKTKEESKTEQEGSKKNSPQKAYLYMHFSAMKWKNYVENDKVFAIDFPNKRIDVCFATHCSRNELVYFVNYFSVKKVVGFRDPYVGPVNSMHLNKFLHKYYDKL